MRVGGDVGHQLRLSVGIKQHHFCMGNLRGASQDGGNFAQLNTKTAQFHLLIRAPQVVQVSLWAPDGDIAGAIHA